LEPRDDLGPTARKQVPVTAAEPPDVVFLFDVDNTLLDNDQVTRDLRDHLAHEYGEEVRDRSFAIFEDVLKVERSGLWRAFAGNVLIYVHKEAELENVERLFLARRYVMVDDKVRILTAIKEAWGPRVTTVFIRQGHYALDAGTVASYPSPDVALERIDCLLEENVLAHLMGHT
jgi:hypothetical protein